MIKEKETEKRKRIVILRDEYSSTVPALTSDGPAECQIPKLVEDAVRIIEERKWSTNVSDYGTRLKKSRQDRNLTQEEAGLKIDRTHSMIYKLEKSNNPQVIDLLYLEMFSLIYDVSPYYLVGQTDKSGAYTLDFELQSPMIFEDDEKGRIMSFIITKLAKGGVSAGCLEAMIKMTSMKSESIFGIEKRLQENTITGNAINDYKDGYNKKSLEGLIDGFENMSEFQKKLDEERIMLELKNDAHNALCKLLHKRDDLLELFAVIANSTELAQMAFTVQVMGYK